jgi:two-component system, OmpR family, alkaline phosphatase synthesis response regulator PhoP
MVLKTLILVIEDDEDIANNIKYNLERQGAYQVLVALTGEEGLELSEERDPGLIILDINLPGINGFEICRRLRHRANSRHVPVLILSAHTTEDDKVHGFNLGADDYVTKPFSMRELVARVAALLKRGYETASALIYQDNRLKIDVDRFEVHFEGQPLTLTRKEFQLLKMLAENRGRILTRDVLLERVWGLEYLGESRTIDVHISRLRQKLGGDDYIQTIVGLGYRFQPLKTESSQ